ncbi:DNA/RNA polymerases superfamily protein [Tanacetum coccineum]
MLLDSLLYLEYLKLDHCYLLPISLPELFVSSHGGTMTMSLIHQWHDTICGGVISPWRSLLYGAYGCILGATHSVSDHEYQNCPLRFDDKIRSANLFPLDMSDFDISLGINWLTVHRAPIVCHTNRVIFGSVWMHPSSAAFSFPVAVIFKDTAYEDVMDTPYWELVKRVFFVKLGADTPYLLRRIRRIGEFSEIFKCLRFSSKLCAF